MKRQSYAWMHYTLQNVRLLVSTKVSWCFDKQQISTNKQQLGRFKILPDVKSYVMKIESHINVSRSRLNTITKGKGKTNNVTLIQTQTTYL